ncbi:MAG: hypothetical protein ACK58T_31305, partial [Phycisphaerae bacterium]
MAKRMLVDASHLEETRVVILDGNKVEEFDYESASRRPLKGNIYLAKVTRVEPSLQACFVEYGGTRHGFLALEREVEAMRRAEGPLRLASNENPYGMAPSARAAIMDMWKEHSWYNAAAVPTLRKVFAQHAGVPED